MLPPYAAMLRRHADAMLMIRHDAAALPAVHYAIIRR